MIDADTEDLIAHLSGGLHPDDRDAFRQAAETALAEASVCWGPGLIHRTVTSIWRPQAVRLRSVSAAGTPTSDPLAPPHRNAGAIVPQYCFTRIELQWHGMRQCPGVNRLVRSGGDEPAHATDQVIDTIRKRERNCAIGLPSKRVILAGRYRRSQRRSHR
jgi:hypothetical protein